MQTADLINQVEEKECGWKCNQYHSCMNNKSVTQNANKVNVFESFQLFTGISVFSRINCLWVFVNIYSAGHTFCLCCWLKRHNQQEMVARILRRITQNRLYFKYPKNSKLTSIIKIMPTRIKLNMQDQMHTCRYTIVYLLLMPQTAGKTTHLAINKLLA